MTAARDVKMMRALGAVADERVRQHTKWGQQDHPDLPPGLAGEERLHVFRYLGIDLPEVIKADVDGHATVGESNWALIALEEMAEAVEAAWLGDVAALRTELVQTAAVLVQWIEAIDRRPGVTS
ncbi:hypothetical protein [Klenkia brasiliensis]|uniref:Uncharacterized protein n=1 Tax=Klenkia brasiliensis TaxID=333142 RepID=A0A1G7YI44_9ACTN|nr:hypothetical protein [Klenkia brasiliensis]SDG96077.1 hypothetical protein SAMN05660324_3967 [Klenkia brasiliensis]